MWSWVGRGCVNFPLIACASQTYQEEQGREQSGKQGKCGWCSKDNLWTGRQRQRHEVNPFLTSARLLFLLSASELMPAPTDCSLKYVLVLCPAELCFSGWLHCPTPPRVEQINPCCLRSTAWSLVKKQVLTTSSVVELICLLPLCPVEMFCVCLCSETPHHLFAVSQSPCCASEVLF